MIKSIDAIISFFQNKQPIIYQSQIYKFKYTTSQPSKLNSSSKDGKGWKTLGSYKTGLIGKDDKYTRDPKEK